MPSLTTKITPRPGQDFDAVLADDGQRHARPVRAQLVSEFWIRIDDGDLRQVLGATALDGALTYRVSGSRILGAEVRGERLATAIAQAKLLQTALGKLDPADQGRARALRRTLNHWLEPTMTKRERQRAG